MREIEKRLFGRPYSSAFRYQVSNPNFSLGISAEKDSGEEFFRKVKKEDLIFTVFTSPLKKYGFVKYYFR